jgi:hypothetical protein
MLMNDIVCDITILYFFKQKKLRKYHPQDADLKLRIARNKSDLVTMLLPTCDCAITSLKLLNVIVYKKSCACPPLMK